MSVPYLGSKISLISKAEIRYEGILYSIDPNESTVALAKVRSFGTEERPTDRPVPPRDEVFEYIIFRGRDIKDLHVCAPPQPMASDPAIVQSSEVQNTNNGNNLSPGMGFQSPHHPLDPQQQMVNTQHRLPPPGLVSPPKPPSQDEMQAGSFGGMGSNQPVKLSPETRVQPCRNTLTLQYLQYRVRLSTCMTQAHDRSARCPLMQTHPPPLHRLGSVMTTFKSGPNVSGPFLPQMPPGPPTNASHHGNYDPSNYGNENQGGYIPRGGGPPHDGRNYYPDKEYFPPSRGRDGYYGNSNNADNNVENYGRVMQQPLLPQPPPPLQQQQQHRHYNNQHHQYNPHYHHSNYRGLSNFNPNMRGRPRGVRSGRGGQRLTFDQEFDFESSNAQFDKEQIEKELKEKLSLDDRCSGDHHQQKHQQQQRNSSNNKTPNDTTQQQQQHDGDDKSNNAYDNNSNHSDDDRDNNEQPVVFYDKSKSFFDKLSCDSLDKNKRSNWKEERKLNCETFGLVNNVGRGGYYNNRGYNSRSRYNHYYRGAPRRAGGLRGYGGRDDGFYGNSRGGRGRPVHQTSGEPQPS